MKDPSRTALVGSFASALYTTWHLIIRAKTSPYGFAEPDRHDPHHWFNTIHIISFVVLVDLNSSFYKFSVIGTAACKTHDFDYCGRGTSNTDTRVAAPLEWRFWYKSMIVVKSMILVTYNVIHITKLACRMTGVDSRDICGYTLCACPSFPGYISLSSKGANSPVPISELWNDLCQIELIFVTSDFVVFKLFLIFILLNWSVLNEHIKNSYRHVASHLPNLQMSVLKITSGF